jgi:glyoxylase-like metal-dependent hydrolase (beta-lactamase superfamily II)
VVYLSRLNVLFTGDILFHGMNPVLKEESGANVASWINALDTLLARWGNARIVPGHGNVGHKELMLDMRQYFVDMTTAARDPKRRAELTAKYADWVTVPGMASPATTIEFILKGNAH